MATPSAFTADMLREIMAALDTPHPPRTAFVSPQGMDALRKSVPAMPRGDIFGQPGTWGGMRLITLPASLYRAPDPPLKSRGKRKPIRARRKQFKRGFVAKYGPWPKRRVVAKGRKIKSMKGLPRNFAYLVDDAALRFW